MENVMKYQNDVGKISPVFRADDLGRRLLRTVFSTFDFHKPLLPNKQDGHHRLITVKAQNY